MTLAPPRLRLLHGPHRTAEEQSARADLETRIQRFWAASGDDLRDARRGPTRRAAEASAAARLARELPGLGLEIDPPGEGDATVVVAPLEDPGLLPLASLVVASAPEPGGVRVVPARAPMTLALAVRDVAERTGLDLSQARARVGIGRGHLLEVVLQAAGFGSGVDDGALDAANLLLPRLVGDRVFDDWIAAVDVAPLARAPGGLRLIAARGEDAAPTIPIDELPAAVQAARDGAEASLPLLPYHAFCERAEWTLLEAGPSRRPASARLPDVPLLSTMVPEAAKCLLEGQRFSSCRFSRHGESFVLASLLLEGGDPEARLALRVELEERLDRALAPGGFGCVVGAGLGSRHAHLLLALPALDAGLDALARALRRLGADRDARLWPCDSRLAYEWVGVWEEPPRVLH